MSKHSILLNHKKYVYTIKKNDQKTVHFHCEAAKISQPFLKEDIPNLLIDLPNLILAEKNYRKKTKQVIRFRVTIEDKKIIESKTAKEGFPTISAFLRHLVIEN